MLEFKTISNIIEAKQCLNILKSLNNYYPNFDYWFWNKVVPDSLNKDGEIIIALKQNIIVGVSIIKNNSQEKKLRCLRIKDEYQNKGYGLYLIDESLKRLNEDKPILTVSEDMFPSYARIFINRYNFEMTYVHKNLYQKNKLEYEFNNFEKNKITTHNINLYKDDLISLQNEYPNIYQIL